MFLSYSFFEKVKIIIDNFGGAILDGVLITLYLSVVGTIIGFLIALVLSSCRIIKIKKTDSLFIKVIKNILIGFSKVYVTVFRGTPMIVQAVIFYYTFTQYIIDWSPLQAGLFTVSLNTAAYLTEIIKSAIQNLDKGQEEAALCLGFGSLQTKLFIIFPQAIKNSMAPICNEFVVNIKDTAVLSLIAVNDLYQATRIAAGKYYWYIETMLLAAAIYLVLTYTTSLVMSYIEKKLGVTHMSIPNNTEVMS